ncbi:MAG: TspO/MBR family protein [Candidatus Micrarchaeaceae archaeon]
MKGTKIITLVSSVALCEVVGNVGTLFTIPAIPTWYATLAKPIFTPPNWVFAPTWLVLYLLMGISLYLVVRRASKGVLAIFGVQLALNVLWSFSFFGLKSTLGGLITAVALFISIVATMVVFWKTSKAASLLLLPYMAWSAFAAALNLFVLVLN